MLWRMKVPGNESSRANPLGGANVSGNDSSREQIGQGTIGTLAPGRELAGSGKARYPATVYTNYQKCRKFS